MTKEKSVQDTELITPDKIKKEPGDEGTTPVSVSKPSAASKTITMLTSPPDASTKTSSGQPKTILLVQTVNNRTGGIQSLLLPQGLRSLPTTTSELSLLASRAKMSTLLTVTSSALKSQPSAAPKMAECLLTMSTSMAAKPATSLSSQSLQSSEAVQQASQSQIQAQADIKSIVKISSVAMSNPLQRICELTFKSRTIKADGTVCTLKEYLCNFCQFMVASQDEFREHFMTHVFSCNYCGFRAFTRFEVLSHKKEKHQGIAEELAGYEGLDSFSDQMNSIIADWKQTEMPKTSSSLPIVSTQMPVVSSPLTVITMQQSAASATNSEMVDSDSSSVLKHTPKASTLQPCFQTDRTVSTSTPITVFSCHSNTVSTSRTHSVSTISSATSQPLAVSNSVMSSAMPGVLTQKITPVVITTAVSSPVVLPMSTVKTMGSVGKSNDNYFTYKIVHDAAGKVQAYECDVCNFRSTKINEIFAHASTHTINDLVKSNSNNVQWECFYCSFASVLQANVVSHVIAKHQNKPIQLKRMVSSNPTQRSTSRSLLFRGPNFMSDITTPVKTSSLSIKKEKNSDETLTTLATMATVGTATKKVDDAGDGCMWGCYYCSVQSVDRNEIIVHLKKHHAQQKLVITRRRITHIPVSQSSTGDGQLETAEPIGEPRQNDGEMISVDKTNGDVQIGDIDSTDPQHSLLKSRRKQVLPRKVPDDMKLDDADESVKTTKSSEAALPINKGKRRFQSLPVSKESTGLTELNMPGGRRKTRKSSEVNIGGSAKRIKLKSLEVEKKINRTNDSKQNAMIVIDGHEGADDVSMPALEDISNFKLKPPNRKNAGDVVTSLETHVASDSSITNSVVNEMTGENDKEMPILHPELRMQQQPPESKSRKVPEISTGNCKQALEGSSKPVDFPDDFIVNDSQLFHYDAVTSETSCNRCSFTLHGLNARNHMREHCMSHTGGQLWKCPYCPFKCGRCSMIVKHVRSKHKNRPLNAIQRKFYPRSSENRVEAPACGIQSRAEYSGTLGKPKRPTATTKIRGPRSVRESYEIQWGSHLWECPFCGRRSLFKGSLKIHMKVAHPSENSEANLKRMPRPKLFANSIPFSQKAVIDIVPIESMHLYDSLGTLLLDNGSSLKYDLDIDDDMDDDETVTERTGLRYQCSHCGFRNLTPQVIKIHILQIHPGESVTVLDQRSGHQVNDLFLCSNTDCYFASNNSEVLKMHACKMAETEKPVEPSGDRRGEKTRVDTQDISVMESQLSSDISTRLRTQNKSHLDGDVAIPVFHSNAAKPVDTSSSESHHDSSHLSVNFRKRIKTPEGPIDYNDDGTLKGVDLECGSVSLQCRYCDYPSTTDPVEIKVHLAAKHPRLQPIAVDVDVKEKGGLAYLFICSIFGCDYSSRYSNVFEHHMNVEHPEVESVRLVKKKRSQKRNLSEKFRIQAEVPRLEQNESVVEESTVEENQTLNCSKSSDDCANKDLLPIATIASPTASTFSQAPPSPVGTVSSDASNAVGDSPAAVGSPDDIQISDSPFPPKDPNKPGRRPRIKNQNFDFPCRYECIQCSFRVGTPEDMKSHLVVKHRENFRNFYCIDRRARELRKRQKIIFCRDSRCGFYCKFSEELENHEKYTCSFAPTAHHLHQRATPERVLQYMDSVMKTSPGASRIEVEKLYQVSGGSRTTMLDNANNKMYQCSHCTFITTDLHNIRMHVIAEHASTEGGFAEIKTELGTDGNIVMNVNDRGLGEPGKSATNANLTCNKRDSRSMYDAVDTVKVDDEEKVYTVL